MNAQNIPEEAKNIFVAEDGYEMAEIDYSNLELRVLAVESDDDVLKKIFKEGRNVHTENCKRMFGIDESNALWGAARRACKTYIFGRNYGGGLKGIFERVVKAVPELQLTYARFAEIDRAYRRDHPRYTKWVNRITEQVRATRKLKNGIGRVRYFLGTPDQIVRAGLNFPVQCLGFGTRVLTTNLEWKCVEDLTMEDKLVAFDEEKTRSENGGPGYRRWQLADITCLQRDVENCYEILFDDGKKVTATGEHKWLCHAYNRKKEGMQWRRTDELMEDKTLIPYIIPPWEEDRSYGAGYLAGAFDADGTLYQTGTMTTVKFCQIDNIVQQTVKRLLEERSFDYLENVCRAEGRNYTWTTTMIKGGIAEQLRFLGQLRPKRLLERFDLLNMSRRMCNKGGKIRKVISVKNVGVKSIIRIATSTKTFFAEGMPTHNSLAADVMNRSLIKIHELSIKNKDIKLIGTVHDSVLIEVKKGKNKNKLIQQVRDIMEAPFEIREETVAFPVDIKIGGSWADLQSYSEMGS